MAARWVRVAGTSFAGAAVVAIAQVGVVHGLGIVDWGTRLVAGGELAWRALLTWLVFLFGAAVLGGAVAARGAIRAVGGRGRVVTARVLAALSAGLGAAAAFPLVWVPATGLTAPVADHPEIIAAGMAVAGIAVGVVLAVAALTSPPIGVGTAITVAWVWLFALTSAAMAYLDQSAPSTPRLAVIDPPRTDAGAGIELWSSPFLMVAAAGFFGLIIAAAGRWLAAPRLGITLSGFAGPALIAGAYLIAGLGGEVVAARLQPYVASLLAVTVGLLASTAIGGMRRRGEPVVVGTIAAPRAIPAVPRRLAIEAAPQPAYTEREPVRASRGSSRPAKAITAQPHQTKRSGATSTSASTGRARTASASSGSAPSRSAPSGSAPSRSAPSRSAPSRSAPSRAKAARVVDAVPAQPERLLITPGSEEDKQLRPSERDHISWMEKLVNTPADPDLTRPRK